MVGFKSKLLRFHAVSAGNCQITLPARLAYQKASHRERQELAAGRHATQSGHPPERNLCTLLGPVIRWLVGRTEPL